MGREPTDAAIRRCEVLVIGSGAGGATTAASLAERGYDVLVIEEGPDVDTSRRATNSPSAFAELYRDRGLTPILGKQSIAYVEGRCVGGSTEVNSAFWHRLSAECYDRWRGDAMLADCTVDGMQGYFERLERDLSVSYLDPGQPLPRSSERFRRGIEAVGWRYTEVPRCQKDSKNAFAAGAKQSMQRTFLPKALAAGASLIADCRARRLQIRGSRVTGVLVDGSGAEGGALREIRADYVFVCGGAIQSAALLRRSGIRRNVGENLRLHPMIKAAALFDEEIGADEEPLPVYQVNELRPNISIGGSVFTPGFLAMLLADHGQPGIEGMRDWNRMALYYAATRAMNRGTIRTIPGGVSAVVRYRLTGADQLLLSTGLSHLGEILFAAGARAVYPSLRSFPVLRSVDDCRGMRKNPVPLAAMSLSTVHAFSSCPMGENPDLCATDSFGKVRDIDNLYVNDASLLPDSPGVNPQGTIMAIALRNSDHFADAQHRRRRRGVPRSRPAVLLTGAPGWLGTRLAEVLTSPSADSPMQLASSPALRCLVEPTISDGALRALPEGVEVVRGDLGDPTALAELCAGAEGAVLFHLAGVIHPTAGVAELARINVDGTERLLRAAAAAGARRVVAMSSNSPFGFNPHRDHSFDEASPYRPHMGYGRSKQRMEELVRAAGDALETTIIRAPWFYGPHQPARQTRFFRMVRAGRFPILGDGEQRRSMAYIDNLCQGLLLAASSPVAAGKVYWIADERPYSVNEIVATVRDVLEKDLGLACAGRQLRLPAGIGALARLADGVLQATGIYNQTIHVLGEMDQSIACSVEKAKRELGYAPQVSLREGMLASLRWCMANGQWI